MNGDVDIYQGMINRDFFPKKNQSFKVQKSLKIFTLFTILIASMIEDFEEKL